MNDANELRKKNQIDIYNVLLSFKLLHRVNVLNVINLIAPSNVLLSAKLLC